jgi:drug/metabolite transporter (DMT)-like permease
MGKYALRSLTFFSLTALRMALTSLMALPIVLAVAGSGTAIQIDTTDWMFIAAIVLSTGSVAVFFYYYGLQRVPASHATLYELFWPLSAVFIDWVVYDTVLAPLQIVGGLMLVGVSVALSRRTRPTARGPRHAALGTQN